MTLINTLRIAGLSTLLFAFAGIATAQATTDSAALTMNATVQTAVQLNISTSAIPGAEVTGAAGSGAFTVDLGNVNGLGIGSPATGVSVTPSATYATYSTPINVTPIYSGFTTQTATVSKANAGGADEGIAFEGSTAANMVLMTTTTEAFTGAASGSTNTRYVGFRVARTKAAGPLTTVIMYSVVVD